MMHFIYKWPQNAVFSHSRALTAPVHSIASVRTSEVNVSTCDGSGGNTSAFRPNVPVYYASIVNR
jgi:hypothetical protein